MVATTGRVGRPLNGEGRGHLDENLSDAQITRRQLLRIEQKLDTVKNLMWGLVGFAVVAAFKIHGWF